MAMDLSHISWSAYFTYLGLALLGYGLIVILTFYRKEAWSFLRGEGGEASVLGRPGGWNEAVSLMGMPHRESQGARVDRFQAESEQEGRGGEGSSGEPLLSIPLEFADQEMEEEGDLMAVDELVQVMDEVGCELSKSTKAAPEDALQSKEALAHLLSHHDMFNSTAFGLEVAEEIDHFLPGGPSVRERMKRVQAA